MRSGDTDPKASKATRLAATLTPEAQSKTVVRGGGMGSNGASTPFEGWPRDMGSSTAALAVRLRGGMAFAASRRLAAATRGFGFRAPGGVQTRCEVVSLRRMARWRSWFLGEVWTRPLMALSGVPPPSAVFPMLADVASESPLGSWTQYD